MADAKLLATENKSKETVAILQRQIDLQNLLHKLMTGEPLPEFEKISGDVGENLARIKHVVSNCEIELVFEQLDSGVKGSSSGGRIKIADGLPVNERFAVSPRSVYPKLSLGIWPQSFLNDNRRFHT